MSRAMFDLLLKGLWETVVMTGVSGALSFVIGLPLASIVGNWYGQAMGLSSGFYIKTGGSASGFLLANDGSVMHDFSPPPSR